ncbi:hypothetical protein [Aurantimicrobium minutum]|uniref:Head-to-tail stopper n=1 Tax=Aurantimicrobium minutum TaxID=708131 RepID=A0A173LXP3_9MICO|nr:hypothetical protein [Aurantimicrobium minutum]BAU99618.1 Predicted protein [Aurantimicrobium minutum]
MGESVTIIRRTLGAVDDYGNPTFTTAEVTVPGCLVGWGSTNEPVTVEGSPIDTQMMLYMPAGSTVQDEDIFVVRGNRYVKDGFSQEWTSMLNVSKGVVVALRRRDG